MRRLDSLLMGMIVVGMKIRSVGRTDSTEVVVIRRRGAHDIDVASPVQIVK